MLGTALATAQFLEGNAFAGAGPKLGEPEAFTAETVRGLAQALAQEVWKPAAEDGADIPELDYDAYRHIRFRPEAAIWRGEGSSFQLQLFHLGWLFRTPVAIDLVEAGQARRLQFDTAMFSYGTAIPPALRETPLPGFAGFRIHAPINSASRFDEFTVFQGASYFRAVAAGQNYGLSARGLAISTAEPAGEEFPEFRHFWIEKPQGKVGTIVVHALLDSPSATGAYRFTIRPGATTSMDVEAVLYPRTELAAVGLAPLTSMFYFGPQDRVGIDDFREAVHDSDGLVMWNGGGEWICRPVLNPETLQISTFMDNHPRGFGLVQRKRRFEDFQDLEARYERRPSLWVEPVGDWGAGSVMLVEIPSDSEANDNVVAFWRPGKPLAAGAGHQFAYRLSWCEEPVAAAGIARVEATRVGLAGAGASAQAVTGRVFVIDFAGPELAELAAAEEIVAVARSSAGVLGKPVLITDPDLEGVRVSLELEPEGEAVVELDCTLTRNGAAISEKWVYRWLA